jgi:hypothetical protein
VEHRPYRSGHQQIFSVQPAYVAKVQNTTWLTDLSKAEWCVDCLWFMIRPLKTPWNQSKWVGQSPGPGLPIVAEVGITGLRWCRLLMHVWGMSSAQWVQTAKMKAKWFVTESPTCRMKWLKNSLKILESEIFQLTLPSCTLATNPRPIPQGLFSPLVSAPRPSPIIVSWASLYSNQGVMVTSCT